MKAGRRLVIDDGDTSAAIVSLLGTMPREDQAELMATLQPKAVRLRWLEPPDAARVIAILDDLDLDRPRGRWSRTGSYRPGCAGPGGRRSATMRSAMLRRSMPSI